MSSITEATNLEELLAAIDGLTSGAARDRLLTGLPTFGGPEPSDTAAIWSWDERRLIIGEGRLEIVYRADWNDMSDDVVPAGAIPIGILDTCGGDGRFYRFGRFETAGSEFELSGQLITADATAYLLAQD